MTREMIATDIRQYISSEVLEGKDEGLDDDAPLLEWGIINSIEISKLVARIQANYGVRLGPKDILPANFESVRALSALVLSRMT